MAKKKSFSERVAIALENEPVTVEQIAPDYVAVQLCSCPEQNCGIKGNHTFRITLSEQQYTVAEAIGEIFEVLVTRASLDKEMEGFRRLEERSDGLPE